MKAVTMLKVAEAIQLLQLDGYDEYSDAQIAIACGISRKTLQRDPELVTIIDFAINPRRYQLCPLWN